MTMTSLQFSAIVQVNNTYGRFWIADGSRREMLAHRGLQTFGFDFYPACDAPDYILHEGDAVSVNGVEYQIGIAGNAIILA